MVRGLGHMKDVHLPSWRNMRVGRGTLITPGTKKWWRRQVIKRADEEVDPQGHLPLRGNEIVNHKETEKWSSTSSICIEIGNVEMLMIHPIHGQLIAVSGWPNRAGWPMFLLIPWTELEPHASFDVIWKIIWKYFPLFVSCLAETALRRRDKGESPVVYWWVLLRSFPYKYWPIKTR